MTTPTLERHGVTWLDGHAEEWVAAGLISPDQARSIRRFEHLDEPAAPGYLTVVAEIASYLGSVIALVGGAAIIGPNWDRLGMIGQLMLALAITAVGFVVGTWLVHLAEPGTMRLGSFLWVLGTGGVAMAATVVMHEIDPRDQAWSAVVIGGSILVIGCGLWRNLDRPLQLLTVAGGLGASGAGVAELLDASVWAVAPTVWIVSAGFGVLAAFGRVRPRLVALAASAAGILIGSFAFAGESEGLAAVIALLSSAVIVSLALHDRTWLLVALGLFGFFMATASMMQTVLHGMGSRLTAVLIGLVIVAYVAMRAQRMGRDGPAA